MKQRLTRTNSGVDSLGAVRIGRMELEAESYLIVLGGAILAILAFLLCGDMSFFPRALIAALPLVLTLGWVKYFVYGRPPHYVGDFFEGLLVGPHFRLPVPFWGRRQHPLWAKAA